MPPGLPSLWTGRRAARAGAPAARRSLTPARELLRDDERVVAQLLLREDLGELLGLEERRERAQLALAGQEREREVPEELVRRLIESSHEKYCSVGIMITRSGAELMWSLEMNS